MNKNVTKLLATAMVVGLIAGGSAMANEGKHPGKAKATKGAKKENSCKGDAGCKGKDKNSCKGKDAKAGEHPTDAPAGEAKAE